MKQLEKFLNDNNLEYKYLQMGNMLYLPEYHPIAIKILFEDINQFNNIFLYLKKKKKYFFKYDYRCKSFMVMLADEQKKLNEIEKNDRKIIDRFWEIHSKDKQKAERFYRFMIKKLKTA